MTYLGSKPLWAYKDLKFIFEPTLQQIPADVLPNAATIVSNRIPVGGKRLSTKGCIFADTKNALSIDTVSALCP